MVITFWKGVFVADQPDEKILRRAGFKLHEPTTCQPATCKACHARIGRRYFSTRIEHATRLRKYCNQRALDVMKKHLAKLAQSRAVDASIQIPSPPGLSYKPYQRAGVAYAVQRKDTLFADDMGLGKTVEALGFLNYVRAQTVLIVCPATLVWNWLIEARRWLVADYEFFLPRNGRDSVPITNKSLVVITNYEKIVGQPSSNEEVRDHTPLSSSLHSRSWDVGIFDEAQALKHPDSLRSQAVLGEGGLYEKCRRTLFMTGTPMENRPIEIWPIAATLCPARFGDWWEFARRYCGLHQEIRGRRTVMVADGASNHSELQQRLRTSFMIRRLKADVLPELPPKQRQLVLLDDRDVDWSRYPQFLQWQAAHQAAYDDAMARLEAASTLAEYRLAVKALDAVSIPFTEISGFRHQSALLKLPSCLRFTDHLLSAGLDALVIYAHHRDVLEQVHNHYGDDSCVIYGDTPMKDRIPTVDLFQSGKKKIFIGGLKAASTGITLTRASTMVFFEHDWNPAVIGQAEDRLCRLGQKKMVHAFHPVLNASVDANMVKMTIAKQTVIDRILDETTEEMRTTLPKASAHRRTSSRREI
jgi:SWI/SNF-related matrix-associated actin-dependent regulator 1 of chromatin subfamily A